MDAATVSVPSTVVVVESAVRCVSATVSGCSGVGVLGECADGHVLF